MRALIRRLEVAAEFAGLIAQPWDFEDAAYAVYLRRREEWEKRKADAARLAEHKRKNAANENAKYRALSLDERRARNRALYEAVKADPVRLEKRRAWNREWMRRRRATQAGKRGAP